MKQFTKQVSKFIRTHSTQLTKDWNPALYEKFKQERSQPWFDMLNTVTKFQKSGAHTFKKIVDLGCGTGDYTAQLLEKFPKCKIIGVDNSPAMIKECKERHNHPDLEFKLLQIEDLENEMFDMIVSNSSLHWIPDHPKLVEKLIKMVNVGGILAFQVPTNHTQEFYVMMKEVALEKPFVDELKGWTLRWPCLEIDQYAELLHPYCGKQMQIVERMYPHILNNADAVVDWVSGTGLRSYLNRFENEDMKEKFVHRFSEKVKEKYPSGEVFFPFRRIIAVATRIK